MFDNLLNLVKEHAGDAIVNNPAIPNEKNDEAIHSTTTSIVDTLKSQMSGGNLSALTDMFKGGNVNASSVASSVQSNVVTDLMKKFGIDNAQASGIASSLIPKVMESFTKKTNDPNDSSFDMSSIMSSLGGGAAAGGIGGMLKGLFN
jgi:uncharacterized protein YidB (DUF937 family)